MSLRASPLSYIPQIESEARHIISARASQVEEPYNYCRQASFRLMDDLLIDGHAAQMLRCKGLKTAAGDADARWINLGPQSFWVHFIVRIGDDVVDLTRRQFFPLSGYPFVQSYKDCDAEWDDIGLVG